MSALTFLELAFHQLWQSAVLALCAWLILKSHRHWSAESRYWVWTLALVLAAALPFLSLLPFPRATLIPDPVVASIAASMPGSASAITSASSAFVPSITQSTSAVSWPMILLALWSALVLVRLISLARGWNTLRRWKRQAHALYKLPLPRAALQGIQVRQSGHVSVPMVVGIVRPCILLPAGIGGRLTRRQLALVLLHEIAHVRRGDSRLQFVQRLIEAVYFYNPFVRAMSRRVEQERECSCDDRAIRAGTEHGQCAGTDYADCLLSVSRHVALARAPVLSVGAMRRPSQLRARIERLLERSDSVSTHVAWTRVVVASAALTAMAGALSLSLPRAHAAESAQRRSGNDAISAAFVRQLAEDGMDAAGARQMIAAGADVNYALQGDGTPLINATRSGNVSLIRLLLENGADVDRFSSGDGNPLIAASALGNLQVAKMLVELGADVNAQDPYDETPLINAARSGHSDVVGYLISKGADVSLAVEASTLNGVEMRSPLSEARKAGHTAIVERLQQSGAR